MSRLPRTLEPPPQSVAVEAAEYHAMDHRSANSAFVADLLRGAVGPDLIDLGCGPAAIPIELCRQLPAIRVMAIDAETEALDLAQQDVDIEGLRDRISLVHADASALDEFEADIADTVISNSLLHHLAEPRQGLVTALRLLRPGGRLFVRDLMRPASATELESIVLQHAGDETEHAQQLLRQSLHAALTLEEIRNTAETLAVSPAMIAATSDRHWTIDWIAD